MRGPQRVFGRVSRDPPRKMHVTPRHFLTYSGVYWPFGKRRERGLTAATIYLYRQSRLAVNFRSGKKATPRYLFYFERHHAAGRQSGPQDRSGTANLDTTPLCRSDAKFRPIVEGFAARNTRERAHSHTHIYWLSGLAISGRIPEFPNRSKELPLVTLSRDNIVDSVKC